MYKLHYAFNPPSQRKLLICSSQSKRVSMPTLTTNQSKTPPLAHHPITPQARALWWRGSLETSADFLFRTWSIAAFQQHRSPNREWQRRHLWVSQYYLGHCSTVFPSCESIPELHDRSRLLVCRTNKKRSLRCSSLGSQTKNPQHFDASSSCKLEDRKMQSNTRNRSTPPHWLQFLTSPCPWWLRSCGEWEVTWNTIYARRSCALIPDSCGAPRVKISFRYFFSVFYAIQKKTDTFIS